MVDFAGTLLPMHALEHALRVLSDHEQGKGVMFRRRIYGPLQKLAYIIDGQESCPLDDAESLVGPKRLVELQTMSLIQIYNEQVMFVDNKQKIFFATKEIKKRFGKKVLDITIEDLPQWSLEFYYSCMETVKQIF